MKKAVLSIFYILCSLFVFATPTFAKVMIEDEGNVVIAKGETIDDDLFVGAESISVDGAVTGSVYAGAAMYKQTGNIKGDLILGTGNAIISGTVGGDIYLGAGDVTLSKVAVGGSVIAGAGNLTIDQDSKIGGSLVVASGNLKNSAPVGRSVMAGAGTIYLNSKVGKEARLGAGTITLGSNVNIAGDLNYALGEEGDELSQDPAATVGGTVSRYTQPESAKKDLEKARADAYKFGHMAGRGWLVISFLGSLLIGFILLKVIPKTMQGLSAQITSSPLASLGIGFLIVVFSLPVMLVLALTVIGLPLVGLLIPVLCIGIHVAKLAVSYALGRFIAAQFSWSKMGVYAVFFIGLSVFYLLRSLPGLGWVASFVFTWVGLGSIWIYTRSHLKSL